MKNETFTPERIKDEADAFFEWDGEDRSLVTTTSCLLFAQHIAGLMQARAAQPAPVVPEGSIYVECRQCDKCQHVGINDAAHGLAACHDCDWSGNEPEDDKCPGCKSENCMAAACPECGARYALIASEDVAAAPAQGQQVECQECERLRMQLTACGVVALSNTPESAAKARDMHSDYMSASCQDVMRAVDSEMALRAELAALKAQQVGQELDELRRSCAEILGQDPETWPSHGSAPLAIASALALTVSTTPQPAPAQDVTAVLKMARALSDRQADACNVDREDQWKLYSEDFVADVEAMLAAAPAHPAERQEQGEVQRLREALERATKLLSAAAGYATKMEPMPAKLLNAIDAELDASTGQEVE